jgi:putative ABC transport system permease protein
MIRLAFLSLLSRRTTAALTVAAIAFSTMLFIGVDTIRTAARDSFANTISGTDLIVGARGGSLSLLLYSVFRIGDPTSNISAASWRVIDEHPMAKWTVPLSLGDSHHGFRVLGTSRSYFEHYRYRRGQTLQLRDGVRFDDLFDAVIGAGVAEALGYSIGDKIILGHGLGRVSFSGHDDTPFVVSGILAATGTPVDQTIHVSVEAIEAIHVDWKTGAKAAGPSTPAAILRAMDLSPREVTALLVGTRSKIDIFALQRQINTYKGEPLQAIIPGIALQAFWRLTATAETALRVISGFVVLTALLGMLTAILSTLNERRREMAILRALGAGPLTIAGLLLAEAAILAVSGGLLGIALAVGGSTLIADWLDAKFGLTISIPILGATQLALLAAIVASAIAISFVPAWRVYRQTLSDGMSVRY